MVQMQLQMLIMLAMQTFHQEVANLVDIDRKTAKTIGLGIMYGMGKGKLADQLGVTVDEASEILAKFNTYAPFVRQLGRLCYA